MLLLMQKAIQRKRVLVLQILVVSHQMIYTALKLNKANGLALINVLPGKTVAELLPNMVEQAALSLPIPKRMRWGSSDIQFVRPVHSVMMLYGEKIIETTILGQQTGRKTCGHRFLAPEWIDIPHPKNYLSILLNEGKVIADFAQRKQKIREEAQACLQKKLKDKAKVFISSEEFLDEVTGLVEWPVALCGQFDAAFLTLPQEVLISSMQDHQRYFPIIDAQNKLMPYFIVISNIISHDPSRVIHGNERVLRARLADAKFFYDTDQLSLRERVELLNGIMFQAKLGTMNQKAMRLGELTAEIAVKISDIDNRIAQDAGIVAKTDLTTQLVNEFPELQGVIGYYYALRDKESNDLAEAMREQYLPRFAGDALPQHPLGQALAIADRIDTLVGTFGINHIPTGDKDPYGLRRAALGVLRILIEKKLNLDLKELLEHAADHYNAQAIQLENDNVMAQLLIFMQERLRAWYQEQGITADVFAAVAAINVTNPLDMHARIKAVQAFKKLNEAEALCLANKRVSNILAKYMDTIDAKTVNKKLFENAAEKELSKQLELKKQILKELYDSGKYDAVLLQLAELHKPIDDFFNQVMVMTEDKMQRENRILLLSQLRALFLQVADIALLQ